METTVKVSGISKKYQIYDKPTDRLKEVFQVKKKPLHKEFYALKDIDLTFYKGETVGILGKNGSGKSTLLKVITGVLTPTEGEVQVSGLISPLLELGAGFNGEYTGMENIYHNGVIMGRSKEEIDAKLHEIIEFADIGDFIYQPVKTYSSGMFARLAFATAINIEPEILIVDEILSVGDVRFQAKCMNKFKELKEQGVTILFVTHDVGSVRDFCDRAVWIDKGHVQMTGDTIEVCSEYLKSMFDTEEQEAEIEAIVEEQEKTDFNPINRWGTQKGLIEFVGMFNQKGLETDIINHGESTTISIRFATNEHIDFRTLSVAFSIKNKVGTDLLVSSLADDEIKIKESKGRVDVQFTFENLLTAGDYILVVALENRAFGAIEYYDYIEGAKYFKVSSKKPLFGLYHQEVEKKINYLGGQTI